MSIRTLYTRSGTGTKLPALFLLSTVNFGIRFLWGYEFFNFLTLDDAIRFFSVIHPIEKGDVFIYQFDSAYHGTIFETIIAYPFIKTFGNSVLTIRLMKSFISSMTFFITALFFRKLTTIYTLFVLYTFTPTYFTRNILMAGNYSLIPLFTFLLYTADYRLGKSKLTDFLKGVIVGAGSYNHLLFIPHIIFLRGWGGITGFFVGFFPSILFNIFNSIINGVVIPPTIDDLFMRFYKSEGTRSFWKVLATPFNFLLYDIYFLPLLLIITSSVFYPFCHLPKKVILIFLIYLILSTEERYFLFPLSILIVNICIGIDTLSDDKLSDVVKKKNKIFIKKKIFTTGLIISGIFFGSLSNIMNIKKCEGTSEFINYPYGSKHYICSDKELKENFYCLKSFISEDKTYLSIGTTDIATYSYYNFLSPKEYIIPLFVPWTKFWSFENIKIKHIVTYKKEEELLYSIYLLSYGLQIKNLYRICGNFLIAELQTSISSHEIVSRISSHNKVYIRKSGLIEILSEIWEKVK